MIDMEGIKAQVDCRDIVELEWGKPQMHSTKYNAYKCRFHGEQKGVSFTVYQDGWQCRGKCGTAGNVFTWMKRRHDMEWIEACFYLVRDFHLNEDLLGEWKNKTWQEAHTFIYRDRMLPPISTHPPKYTPRPPAPPESPAEPPPAEWQHYARNVVELAKWTLWSAVGKPARDYLMNERGLSRGMIGLAELGYIPARTDDDYKYGRPDLDPDWKYVDKGGKTKVRRVHCGITIPHFADNQLWAIRVRRPPGLEGSKYISIGGGSKALYWSDWTVAGKPVLIVEGEFDCLIADTCAFNDVCTVAIASASNKQIHSRWYPKLLGAPYLLARMDSDGGGLLALEELQKLTPAFRSVDVPMCKDINEYYLAMCDGGQSAVEAIRRMIWGWMQ